MYEKANKKLQEKEYRDDFIVETGVNCSAKKKSNKKQSKIDTHKKVQQILSNAMEDKDLINIFNLYKKQELKGKLR